MQMAGKVMKAVQYSGYGGGAAALQYVDAPIPTPKKGDLLIKLEATGLNPVDWKIQKGQLRPLIPSKFPFIPAVDIAGEVVSVGPGVNDFTTGDKIVTMLSQRSGGGFLEYAVALINTTVKRPPGVSAENAEGLLTAVLTALQAIQDTAGIKLDGI